MKINDLDKPVLDQCMQHATTTMLRHLLPLELLHCMAAGCRVRYRYHLTTKHVTIDTVNPCIVVTRDGSNNVVVAEQCPEGVRYRRFSYLGPRKIGDDQVDSVEGGR